MATVLFVHGTGVRAGSFADTLRLIEDGCRAFAPDIDRVLAPAWGEDRGVVGGNTGLLPGPEPDDEAGPAPAPDGAGTLPWAPLLADPGPMPSAPGPDPLRAEAVPGAVRVRFGHPAG